MKAPISLGGLKGLSRCCIFYGVCLIADRPDRPTGVTGGVAENFATILDGVQVPSVICIFESRSPVDAVRTIAVEAATIPKAGRR